MRSLKIQYYTLNPLGWRWLCVCIRACVHSHSQSESESGSGIGIEPMVVALLLITGRRFELFAW